MAGMVMQKVHYEGRYHSRQEPDGAWTLVDVPILVDLEIPLLTETGEPLIGKDGQQAHYQISREWMERAIKAAQADIRESGYKAPLHVNHKGVGRVVEAAGFVVPKKVVRGRYRGRMHYQLLADLTFNRPEVYEEIRKGQLRYLSPEMDDVVRQPEINAVALMRDTEPFQRLPPVIPATETPHPAAAQLQRIRRVLPESTLWPTGRTLCHRNRRGVAVLMDFDDKQEDEEAGAKLCDDGNEMPELDEKGKAMMAALSAAFAKAYASTMMGPSEPPVPAEELEESDANLMDDGLPEEQDDVISTGDEMGFEPAEQLPEEDELEEGRARMSAAGAKRGGAMMARLHKAEREARQAKQTAAKLKARLDAQDKKKAFDQAIDETHALLGPYGIKREELVQVAREFGGKAALQSYAAATMKHGTANLESWDGELPTNLQESVDVETAFINDLPAEARVDARAMAQLHRQRHADPSQPPTQALQTFVIDGMIATGRLPNTFAGMRIPATSNHAPQ